LFRDISGLRVLIFNENRLTIITDDSLVLAHHIPVRCNDGMISVLPQSETRKRPQEETPDPPFNLATFRRLYIYRKHEALESERLWGYLYRGEEILSSFVALHSSLKDVLAPNIEEFPFEYERFPSLTFAFESVKTSLAEIQSIFDSYPDPVPPNFADLESTRKALASSFTISQFETSALVPVINIVHFSAPKDTRILDMASELVEVYRDMIHVFGIATSVSTTIRASPAVVFIPRRDALDSDIHEIDVTMPELADFLPQNPLSSDEIGLTLIQRVRDIRRQPAYDVMTDQSQSEREGLKSAVIHFMRLSLNSDVSRDVVCPPMVEVVLPFIYFFHDIDPFESGVTMNDFNVLNDFLLDFCGIDRIPMSQRIRFFRRWNDRKLLDEDVQRRDIRLEFASSQNSDRLVGESIRRILGYPKSFFRAGSVVQSAFLKFQRGV
jgi:hypothetical protein